MIITRYNIELILGTPFSKHFSLIQMKESLDEALPYVRETYPQLYNNLTQRLIALNILLTQERTVRELSENVKKIKTNIEEKKDLLIKAMIRYEEEDQKIVAIIGSTATGGPPLYPTASIETTPLIRSVARLNAQIMQLKSQLDVKQKTLTELIVKHTKESQQIGDQIVTDIRNTDSIDYDTSVSQYLYT